MSSLLVLDQPDTAVSELRSDSPTSGTPSNQPRTHLLARFGQPIHSSQGIVLIGRTEGRQDLVEELVRSPFQISAVFVSFNRADRLSMSSLLELVARPAKPRLDSEVTTREWKLVTPIIPTAAGQQMDPPSATGREVEDVLLVANRAPVDDIPDEKRIGDLVEYLRGISSGAPEERSISPETARSAFMLWERLWAAVGHRLPIPDAYPGPDGQLLYTWDRDEHHFELELFPDGRGEYFYLNRTTNETWELDISVTDPVSVEVVERLELFT